MAANTVLLTIAESVAPLVLKQPRPGSPPAGSPSRWQTAALEVAGSAPRWQAVAAAVALQDGIPEFPETPLTSSVLTALGAEEPTADPLSPSDSIRSLASTVECDDEVGDEYGNKKDIAVAWANRNAF